MVVVVVTAGRLWLRATLAAFVALLVVLGTGTPALAQEDEDSPSLLETAGNLTGCSPAGLVTSGIGAVVAAVTGEETSAPSCVEGLGDVATAGPEALQNVIKKTAEGAFEKAGLSFGEAGAAVLKFALGWWLTIPGQSENSFLETLGKITEYTYYIQVAFLAASLMFLGARLALARSGAIRETSEEGFRQLARATVISGSIGIFVVLGTRLSDGISRWFIDGTVGSNPDALVDAMVQVGVYSGPGGVALLFVIGLIGILGGLVLAFLLLMRTGFLVVISAALPIAGAAGGTKIGSQAYEKMIAWTMAFLLFKPVGSFVIGVAAMLFIESAPDNTANGNEGGAMTALVGVLLLCSAALVLPSIMRLVVPAVGAVGGGGSGMAAASGAAAMGAQVGGMIATGGASAGAGAGAGAGAAGGMGAGGSGGGPPSGADSAPSGFGQGSGQSPGGGTDTAPSPGAGSTGGVPGGGDNGTPGSTGDADNGSGGEPAMATSGAPPASNGGFEG